MNIILVQGGVRNSVDIRDRVGGRVSERAAGRLRAAHDLLLRDHRCYRHPGPWAHLCEYFGVESRRIPSGR